MLELKYTLDKACGWATLSLSDPHAGFSQDISVSYLRDSLRELCEAFASLLEKQEGKQLALCETEPGAIGLELKASDIRQPGYRILLFEDENNLKNLQVLNQGNLDASLTAKQLVQCCQDILEKYGENGYLDKWQLYPFPMDAYNRLKKLV